MLFREEAGQSVDQTIPDDASGVLAAFQTRAVEDFGHLRTLFSKGTIIKTHYFPYLKVFCINLAIIYHMEV
jgi:hypothetical protein